MRLCSPVVNEIGKRYRSVLERYAGATLGVDRAALADHPRDVLSKDGAPWP
jgi:hypothetical protein